MFFSSHFPTFLTNWLKLETRDWALKPSCCLSARNENNKSTTLSDKYLFCAIDILRTEFAIDKR